MKYKIIGYYICEKINAPDFLGIKSKEMITVSRCFAESHPNLSYCYFENSDKDERHEYFNRWNMDENKATMLKSDIQGMFETCLAIDGRFSKLEDAKKICEKYFDADKCVIVSVSTTEEYYGMLINEISQHSSGKNDFFSEESDENTLLGYDILGWDMSNFHTFLCNMLHTESQTLCFNKYCLIENDYEAVNNFAREIQGKGEPVVWIPCRIGGVS